MRKVLRKSCKRLIFNLLCGDSRIRTGDPLLAKQVLYQLSYTPGYLFGYKKKPGWRPAFR